MWVLGFVISIAVAAVIVYGLSRATSAHFLPHNYCYLGNAHLIWLHALSDTVIGISYLIISASLVHLVRKTRRTVPFSWMFIAFGSFILACGVGHFVEVVVIWRPVYWLSGAVKVVTAITAGFTAFILPAVAPRILLERTRLVTAVEQSTESILITGKDGRIEYANPAYTRITGYSLEESLGQKPNMVKSGLHDEAFYRNLWQTILDGNVWQGEITNRKKNGSLYIEYMSITPVRDRHGDVRNFIAVKRDITEHKRAEQQALDWKGRYDAAVLASGQIIYAWEPSSQKMVFGGAIQQVLRYSPADLTSTINWRALIHRDDIEHYREVIRDATETGRSFDLEYRIRLKDGSVRTVRDQGRLTRDLNANAQRMVGFITDVTENRMLEQQLRQSQKMEAVGRLAGGVAHDFNNLLTIMTGYAAFQMEMSEPESQVHKNAEEIKAAVERAAALTHQLLAFSRQQVLQPRRLNLNMIVANFERLLRRLIGEDIEVMTFLADDLESVEADPGQLEQVLMNLVINARDAMPDGGKLTLETANVVLGEPYVVEHPYVKPGRYVRLAVSDDGHGMDAQTKSKIFEPFFTTKEMGKGTGLGLSTVFGIVKQSGGYIDVYSEVGAGTTFKICLPSVGPTLVTSKKEADRMPRKIGSERILLVEDDDQLRTLAQKVLVAHGYQVFAAMNADQVEAICREQTGGIDLLITDVVMPRMGGKEIAEMVEKRFPAIKMLFMSGHVTSAIVHGGVVDDGIFFLPKPFTPIELATKVRQVLDSSGAEDPKGSKNPAA